MTADRGLRPHPRPLSRRARGEDAPGADCPLSCWGAGFYIDEQDGPDARGWSGVCHCDPVLDAGVGSLDGVAGNEIAAWFDRLTMSGCAPHNDRAALLTMTGRWWGYALTRHGGCGTRNVTLPSVLCLCWDGPHTSRRVRHPECYACRRCCACDGKWRPAARGGRLWRPFVL